MLPNFIIMALCLFIAAGAFFIVKRKLRKRK